MIDWQAINLECNEDSSDRSHFSGQRVKPERNSEIFYLLQFQDHLA